MAGRPEAARDLLRPSFPLGHEPLREWAVLTIAAMDLDGINAARELAIPFIEHVSETGNAAAEERDGVLRQLRDVTN
jgi:hypothetical protein